MPSQCMPTAKIIMPTNQVQLATSASPFEMSARLVRWGTSQKVRPKEGERHRGTDGEVEVSRDPGGVVQHQVEIEGGIDHAAGASEHEGDHGQDLGAEGGVPPRQCRDPSEDPSPAAIATTDLERGCNREGGEQAGNAHEHGQHRVNHLPGSRDPRVGELVVEADRRREQQEQDEGEPRERVRNQFPTRLFGHQPVPGNIGRQQPEVDDGVPGVPEQGPRQRRVHRLDEAKRPGDKEHHHLDDDSDGGERPHHEGDDAHVGHDGGGLTRILAAPAGRACEPPRRRP